MAETIEQGEVYFFYRNVVDVERAEDLDDVQHLHLILAPDGRAEARLLVVGRKQLPAIRRGGRDPRERLWLMTLAVGPPEKLAEGLGPVEYETATRGPQRQSEAIPAGAGRYAISLSSGESYLVYRLAQPAEPGPAQRTLGIRAEAGYTIAVRNPDLDVPGFPDQTPDYPPQLRERFGELRWMEVSDAGLLDYRGAQLVLIGSFEDVGAGDDDLSREPDLFGRLGLDPDRWPTAALQRGAFATARYEAPATAPIGDRSKGGRRGARAAAQTASAAGIAKSLEGIKFPARRADLVRHARDHHAPSEVVERLAHLPDRRYGDMADVLKGLGRAESGPQVCSLCGERFDTPSELDQHRRTSHPPRAVSAADLEKALAGVSYPARPAALADYAQHRGHDEAAAVLRELPDRAYRDAAEMARALGEIRRQEPKPRDQPSRKGGARALASLSAARMAAVFEGVDLPATAEQLKRYARRSADAEEMRVIERLEPGRYEDMSDIAEAIGRALSGESDPGA